jgi:hypothetical protein
MSENTFNSDDDNILANNTLLLELLISILPQKPFKPSMEDLVNNANNIVRSIQITPQKIPLINYNYVFNPSIDDLVNNANNIVQKLQIISPKIYLPTYIFKPSINDLVNNVSRIMRSLQITSYKILQKPCNPSILDLVNNANNIVRSLQITPQKISLPTYTFKPSINDLIENAMFIFRGMLLPVMDESKTEFDEKSLPNRFVLSTIDEQPSILDNKYLIEVKKEKDSAGNDIYGIVNKTYDGQGRPNSKTSQQISEKPSLYLNKVNNSVTDKPSKNMKFTAMPEPQSDIEYTDNPKKRDTYTLSNNETVVDGGVAIDTNRMPVISAKAEDVGGEDFMEDEANNLLSPMTLRPRNN